MRGIAGDPEEEGSEFGRFGPGAGEGEQGSSGASEGSSIRGGEMCDASELRLEGLED